MSINMEDNENIQNKSNSLNVLDNAPQDLIEVLRINTN